MDEKVRKYFWVVDGYWGWGFLVDVLSRFSRNKFSLCETGGTPIEMSLNQEGPDIKIQPAVLYRSKIENVPSNCSASPLKFPSHQRCTDFHKELIFFLKKRYLKYKFESLARCFVAHVDHHYIASACSHFPPEAQWSRCWRCSCHIVVVVVAVVFFNINLCNKTKHIYWPESCESKTPILWRWSPFPLLFPLHSSALLSSQRLVFSFPLRCTNSLLLPHTYFVPGPSHLGNTLPGSLRSIPV